MCKVFCPHQNIWQLQEEWVENSMLTHSGTIYCSFTESVFHTLFFPPFFCSVPSFSVYPCSAPRIPPRIPRHFIVFAKCLLGLRDVQAHCHYWLSSKLPQFPNQSYGARLPRLERHWSQKSFWSPATGQGRAKFKMVAAFLASNLVFLTQFRASSVSEKWQHKCVVFDTLSTPRSQTFQGTNAFMLPNCYQSLPTLKVLLRPP